MATLVLIRHGQSIWNLQNRFTGWVDVPLTEKGREEARRAADHIKDLKFDVAYTSMLTRAQETLRIILEGIGQNPPIIRDQALNERHYGDLQGLNKAETAAKFGEAQVKIWRRSYDTPPPPLTPDDERYPGKDPRYQGLKPGELPRICAISTKLKKERELSFYGNDDFLPSDNYSQAQADAAIADAAWLVALLQPEFGA